MKNVDYKENINCIRETSNGLYRIILDFATINILPFLIQDDYKFVWVHNHTTGKGFDWEEFNLPIVNNSTHLKILAKSLNFDFIMETSAFKDIMKDLTGGIELIQMNKIPPYYLNLDIIKGKQRFNILQNNCDFLFEVDIPSATDYGTLISPNKDYLESLLNNQKIDWSNLP
ncbi:hypothetical protein [Rhizosphaericola mali]|uniref:Uncharacterized protein n=1 Tax=Rhizosphaericola mali TaxID=2545455 RepID=A0A5P2FW21_9BACT|nr:hypothetical protein [Rhizosphaericola mali]QES87355.1 hypothetical protein E0W69_001330 [Rhizosphaericola mali]